MKLVDVFMAFLVVVGGIQFLYAVLGGSYVSLTFLVLSERRFGGMGCMERGAIVK